MEKYGFVYIWYDRKRKMYYIGSHWGRENDGYICSSNRMRDAYRRRPQDFRRRILSIINTNRYDTLINEQKWLDLVKNKTRYYNLNFVTTHIWWGDPDYKLTVSQKISKTQTGRKHTEETKKKMSKSHMGKTISNEHRKSLSIDRKKRTYVSNVELNKTMNVFHEDVERMLQEGWYVGRLPGWSITHTSKGKTWKRSSGNIYTNLGRRMYNDGTNMKMLNPLEVPEGWKLGKLKKKEQ